MLNKPENDNFQFLALPKVVAPETVQAVVSKLSLRGWQIAERWAMGAPVTVKAMERSGNLISSLKEQQNLESDIISDARVSGRNQDVPDSEILALHEIQLLPNDLETTETAIYTVVAIDMFHAWDSAEDIYTTGFKSFEEAREYARRRTRDSVEELRDEDWTAEGLRQAWLTYGENCIVSGGEYAGSSEVDFFISEPATAEQRDWVSLTPNAQQAIALHFPENTARKFSPDALRQIAVMGKNDPMRIFSYIPGPNGEAVFDPELNDVLMDRYGMKLTPAAKQQAINEAWEE